jgi:phosphoribosylformimino-5-aminoimidazole carboxamide ribotide isomerase
MELLPAIDLRQGQVVRLTRGDDRARTVYASEPAEILARFALAGVARVHVVDLDAAFGEPPQDELLMRISVYGRVAGLGLQLGGGLRDPLAVAEKLDLGFERAVVGSLIFTAPEAFETLVASHPGRIVAALDVEEGKVRLSGWREEAAEPLSAVCRRLVKLPLAAVLVTDIARDGGLGGPNLDLARRVGSACGVGALLSGGVSSLADLRAAAACPELAGAVVGKALYEGLFSLEEALLACQGEEPA